MTASHQTVRVAAAHTAHASDCQTAGGALVIGGSYRALGVVRAFGRLGIPVAVLTDASDLLATTSRHVSLTITWPAEGDARGDFLLSMAATHDLRGWLLIPTDDESVRALHSTTLSYGNFSLDDASVGNSSMGVRQAADLRARRPSWRRVSAHSVSTLRGAMSPPSIEGFR